MVPSIESLSRELLERLTTEETRPTTTAGTHIVGGLVKAGAKLEALLRVIVQTVADADGVAPETILSPTAGRPLSLRKAMAGPLAHGLRSHLAARSGKPLPKELQPILRDVARKDSSILQFISIRNEIAKEGHEPGLARVPIQKLRRLVSEFRKSAGWA